MNKKIEALSADLTCSCKHKEKFSQLNKKMSTMECQILVANPSSREQKMLFSHKLKKSLKCHPHQMMQVGATMMWVLLWEVFSTTFSIWITQPLTTRKGAQNRQDSVSKHQTGWHLKRRLASSTQLSNLGGVMDTQTKKILVSIQACSSCLLRSTKRNKKESQRSKT